MVHPTERLFIHCFEMELDFRRVVFSLREHNVSQTKMSVSAGFYGISVSKRTVIFFRIISETTDSNPSWDKKIHCDSGC